MSTPPRIGANRRMTSNYGWRMEIDPSSEIEPFSAPKVHGRLGEFLETFDRNGLVRFKGVTDLDHFVDLSDLFTSDFSTYYGKGGGFTTGAMARTRIGGRSTVLSTTGDDQSIPIPLHGEMHYGPNPPRHIWFWCEQAASNGGRTTIADGRKAIARLDAATREYLADTDFVIVRRLGHSEVEAVFGRPSGRGLEKELTRLGFEVRNREDHLEIRFKVRLVKPDRSGHLVLTGSFLPIYLGEMLALKKGERTDRGFVIRCVDDSGIPETIFWRVQAASQSVSEYIDWKDGDAVLIDNHRVMHGRTGSKDASRRIAVRLGEDARS